MGTVLPLRMVAPATAMPRSNAPAHRPTAPAGHGDSDAWASWMARAQAGDKDTYRTLLLAITPYLRAIATRHLGHGEDAEDAVQDILLIVHDIRHTYEPGRPFKPWLATIATRRCIDVLRRRARTVARELPADDALERFSDGAADPEHTTAAAQDARHVRDAVAALSPKLRDAVRLVHLGDRSLQEAADESRQSVGSLKVACHRALKSLRGVLAGKERKND